MDLNKHLRPLYDSGLSLIWLAPKGKNPIEKNWTEGPRKRWPELKASYRNGLNVGVRLGQSSTVNKMSLAVIDCDVKSEDPKHWDELSDFLKAHRIDDVRWPVVLSGRGNGSRHIYVLVKPGTPGGRLGTSTHQVPVYMPSVQPSKRDKENLTEKQIKKGYRWRNAWEVDLMVDGRQAVLPPSVHPDSGESYKWGVPFAVNRLVEFTPPERQTKAVSKEAVVDLGKITWKKVEIDDLPVSKRIRRILKEGGDSGDQSADLLKVAIAMVSRGVPNDTILSVLTEPGTWMGECAHRHAMNTKSRKRAAEWVEKYTLRKAHEKVIADLEFDEIKEVELSDAEAEAQEKRLTHFTDRLEKITSGQLVGLVRPTLRNMLLAMQDGIGNFIGRNLVKYREEFIADVPWAKPGSKIGKLLEDEDIPFLVYWLEREARFASVPKDTLYDAISLMASHNEFDPLRDYIENLEWDGTPRLHRWMFDYVGVRGNTFYIEAISRKFVVGMIERALKPGCKFENMLILEGAQGIRKSSVLRALAGPEWFSDLKVDMNNKDTVQLLQGAWLIEFAELASMKRAEVEEMKHFLSKQEDEIRLPYARKTKNFKRRFVVTGTTNNQEGEGYLKDTTGNRRFWPVRCVGSKIDVEGIAKVRDQLFAEAYYYFMLGEEKSWVDDEQLEKVFQREVSYREVSDPWSVDVQRALENFESGREFVVRDIWDEMHPLTSKKPEHWELIRIGKILSALGYEKIRKGGRDDRKRLYVKK